MRRRNSYEIVAGIVAKVAVTKARTYINFGADWRSDFTAGIEGRVLRANPRMGQDAQLAGGKARRGARAGSSIATDPTSTSRIRARSRLSEETLPGRSSPPAGAMTSSDRDNQPAPKKKSARHRRHRALSIFDAPP